MYVKRYQDLIAWQMGDAFKKEVFRIVKSSPAAMAEHRYRSQIFAAAQSVTANIIEGFLRGSPGEVRHFLHISMGSLGETEGRLRDGIELEYFPSTDCDLAFRYGRRCAVASARFAKSQEARLAARRRSKRPYT